MHTTTALASSAAVAQHAGAIMAAVTPTLDHRLNQELPQDVDMSPLMFSALNIDSLHSNQFRAFLHALIASFSVILVSELGDKTFIITAIMAMKNSRSLIFIASACALLFMTILSVGMGVAVTVVPKVYTHYGSIVLFLGFGLKMLHEAVTMKIESEKSEFEEVKRSLEEEKSSGKVDATKKNPDESVATDVKPQGTPQASTEQQEQQQRQPEPQSGFLSKLTKYIFVAPIVIETFTMIFLAEWGDRSQISTVILAARENVVGVFVGSFAGHLFCTGLAVLGGRFVAEMISVRTMTVIGGLIFLSFAGFAMISGP